MAMLEDVIAERERWLERKDIAPLRSQVDSLLIPEVAEVGLSNDAVEVLFKSVSAEEQAAIEHVARALKPWRKGPFALGELFIDSEWVSAKKYALLEPHINLAGKDVADIGCNNGYYMFRMLSQNPKSITGFDPSPLCRTQFDFINRFVCSQIRFEMLGVEHLEDYGREFDVLFCLGVLYHRSDPIKCLKSLNKGLRAGGELVLDTLMIEGEGEVALTPRLRYAKMANVYFIPTFNALKNWLERAGFSNISLLAVSKTEASEQRKTEWIDSQSLEDFLSPNSYDFTIEGYPAPRRIYIKAYKGA
ncbi:MAG: tRNA 5-methoxyuridine(34)/uridine 5-oxyacetic acid(34) synthase CmoB [Wolinella sp.]